MFSLFIKCYMQLFPSVLTLDLNMKLNWGFGPVRSSKLTVAFELLDAPRGKLIKSINYCQSSKQIIKKPEAFKDNK